jgi:hypothetical protein
MVMPLPDPLPAWIISSCRFHQILIRQAIHLARQLFLLPWEEFWNRQGDAISISMPCFDRHEINNAIAAEKSNLTQ